MKTYLTEWRRFLAEETIESEFGTLKYSTNDDYIFLDAISIDEKHQSKGHGTSLVKKLLKKADELGVKKVYTEQDDSTGSVYNIFNKLAKERGSELNSYVKEKDADFEYSQNDIKTIERFSSRPVIKLNPEDVDPSTFSPLFIELIF